MELFIQKLAANISLYTIFSGLTFKEAKLFQNNYLTGYTFCNAKS